MNRFEFYNNHILSRDFVLKTNCMNIMQMPTFSKIVLNTSIKNYSQGLEGTNQKLEQNLRSIGTTGNRNFSSFIALEMICGQKLKKTRSKKFIAGFKLRKDELIACKVTLRGIRMFSFFEKLIMVVLPKLRDLGTETFLDSKKSFRGQKNQFRGSVAPESPRSSKLYSFDNHGNVSFGLENFLLFPELENHYELFEYLTGFQITLVTNAKNNKEARLLFSGNQIP